MSTMDVDDTPLTVAPFDSCIIAELDSFRSAQSLRCAAHATWTDETGQQTTASTSGVLTGHVPLLPSVAHQSRASSVPDTRSPPNASRIDPAASQASSGDAGD